MGIMKSAATRSEPARGQLVFVAAGPLEGVEGRYSATRDARWLIELSNVQPGVYLIVDPAQCELVGSGS